jgi:hypothetical protein
MDISAQLFAKPGLLFLARSWFLVRGICGNVAVYASPLAFDF